MDILDAVIDAESTEAEQGAYLRGVAAVAEDPDVRKNLVQLSRDNFSRGHNAGYACGIMIAVLQSQLVAAGDMEKSKTKLSASKIAECQNLLTRIEKLSQQSQSIKVRVNEEMFVELTDSDDDDEKKEENAELKIPTVVSFAEEFFAIFKSESEEDSVLDPLASLAPPEALKFLFDTVDYNKSVAQAELETPVHAALSVIITERNQPVQERNSNNSSSKSRRTAKAAKRPTGENWMDW